MIREVRASSQVMVREHGEGGPGVGHIGQLQDVGMRKGHGPQIRCWSITRYFTDLVHSHQDRGEDSVRQWKVPPELHWITWDYSILAVDGEGLFRNKAEREIPSPRTGGIALLHLSRSLIKVIPSERTRRGISCQTKIRYTIKHVGINHRTRTRPGPLPRPCAPSFGLEISQETPPPSSPRDLRGDEARPPGAHGHVALQTDDVEAAMADLRAKGIGFQEDTIRRDEAGRIRIRLSGEQVAGFAFHLTT